MHVCGCVRGKRKGRRETERLRKKFTKTLATKLFVINLELFYKDKY